MRRRIVKDYIKLNVKSFTPQNNKNDNSIIFGMVALSSLLMWIVAPPSIRR
jgi:hypothetical protein